MLLYAGIASLLEDISRAERHDKVKLAASLLACLQREMLCPCVRLLTGELWPSWKSQEMDMGPEAVAQALEEISTEDVPDLRKTLGEMGLVAEAAARHKSQHPISDEPLEAMRVYRNLSRIASHNGPDSEHRRGAILRGLFLDAQPFEAKYIARTVMRNVLVGLGPQTMIAAISTAFGVKAEEVKKAYDLMPELGLVAEAAYEGTLSQVTIKPSCPVRPMRIRPGKMSNVAVPRAYVPKYPGLSVQVHKLGAEYFVYTMRLRDVTSALSILSKELLNIGHDFIADACLVGFQDSVMISLRDMVSYINRRSLSRRSKIVPALVATDLLYLDEKDLTLLAYVERHKRLEEVLGEPKGIPFTGMSTAEQVVLDEPGDVEKYIANSLQKGLKGLIVRDLLAAYRTGRFSDVDYSIRAPMENTRVKNSGS